MPFNDTFNVVLGPNGSGKCVIGSTVVSLADGTQESIGNLVNSKIRKGNYRTIDDGYVIEGDGTEIECLDTKTLQTKKRKIQAYIKRTSPKELISIRTRSGRNITSTTYHPLFVLSNDKIKSVNAEELHKGVRIAVPRKISSPKNRTFYGLLDDITTDDLLYVPFQEEYLSIAKDFKKATRKETAQHLGIPEIVLKSLHDKQSILFSHLVRMLRNAGLPDDQIIAKTPYCKAKNSSKIYKIPWNNSGEFSRLLGYLLAEGRITKNNQIWFTNENEEIIYDYSNLMQKCFGAEAHIKEYKPCIYDVLVYSSPIKILLEKFGMSFHGTAEKSISNIYMQASGALESAEVLNGLYCGDGYISKHTIEITTKSPLLAQGIEILLTRLGITYSSKVIIKSCVQRELIGTYKTIVVRGADNFKRFAHHIQLKHAIKQFKVHSLLQRKGNTNVDLIDALPLIKKSIQELKISPKSYKKTFPKLEAYAYNQCIPSVSGIKELVHNVFMSHESEMHSTSHECVHVLKLLAESDIYWDEIVEIERFSSNQEWVYDLCVEEDHNFVANNIFVHNSNIMDALTFVLGKSSSKALRAEKSANLIYNGGKKKDPAKQAEVSLYFDNKNMEFPTEEKEVKITRIVTQSGQSKYKINDKARTRQQILDLMAIAKINPDGYNIVLQGDIINFCNMSTSGRREIIEEISGIASYEEKKNKALRDLERVEENIREADIVLAERKTYLKELKKDRDQALKYKEMSEKVNSNKATLLNLQITRKKKEHGDMGTQIEDLKKQIAKYEEDIASLKKDNEDKKKTIQDINKEIEEKGEKEQVEINRQVESLKIDITKNTSRISHLESELVKIDRREKDLFSSLQEIKGKTSDLGTQQKELEKRIVQLKKDKEVVDTKIAEFRKKHNLDQAGNIDKEIDEVDKIVEQLQQEMQKKREHQQELIRKKDNLEFQINTIDERIAKVKSVEKEHKNELDAIKKKRTDFKNATVELNGLLNEDSKLSSHLVQARKELMVKNDQLGELQMKENAIQHSINADIAVKRILELKSRKEGIYNTVAELGNVASAYATALEIAAGNRIKSVVVENDGVAAECIKYLKTNKLGTATLLPLNKIRGAERNPEMNAVLKMPGVKGYATDLIEFDPKFKNVFSYVFGNTVVVDSIDVARRVGIGKCKMVTLDGDYCDVSGAMQGGFRSKRKEAMGFRDDDISKKRRKMEGEVQELSGKISGYEQRKQELEDQILRLRTFKAELEGDIIKAERSLHISEEDMEGSIKNKEEISKELNEVDKEMQSLQNDISKQNRDLAQHKIKRQQLRDTITQLRSPTLMAELNTFEEKRGEITQETIKAESELSSMNQQMSSMYSTEKGNIERLITQLDKEREDFKTEIKELQQLNGIKNKELQEKEAHAKKFYAQFKEMFNKRGALSDSINTNDVKINGKQQKSRDLEIKLNTHSLNNARTAAELAGLEQEFEQYKDAPLLKEKDEETLKREIYRFEKMKEEIGNVNMKALEMYERISKEYESLLDKKGTLDKEREDVLKLIEEIDSKKKDLFMSNFNVINEHFQAIFNDLSTKGKAYMELENPEDPFAEGVQIKVKITGNKFLDIKSLSGGEKTMTALAFIFAIQEHDPAEFYILDEVDAALDKKNSERLADLIRKYCSKAQYIVISHNDGIIGKGENLFGVSMDEHGQSKVTALQL
ncbi:MAG: chromosome segregation protein SMC [Candidatus Woesearchaeota archaeon]